VKKKAKTSIVLTKKRILAALTNPSEDTVARGLCALEGALNDSYGGKLRDIYVIVYENVPEDVDLAPYVWEPFVGFIKYRKPSIKNKADLAACLSYRFESLVSKDVDREKARKRCIAYVQKYFPDTYRQVFKL
jgi:hypothetical protein